MCGGKIYNQGHEVIGWAAVRVRTSASVSHWLPGDGIQGSPAAAKGELSLGIRGTQLSKKRRRESGP